MPPRFAYWTILIDGKPTAFRARDQQELLPTVAQLKRTNKDVLLRWFARGKLWESQDAERASWRARDAGAPPRGTGVVRGRDWRPGGQHKDPRQQFRDQKKQRNQERRAERHARREGDRDRPKGSAVAQTLKPGSPGERKPWSGKPRERKPWSGKPRDRKPWHDKPREGSGAAKAFRPASPGERKPWSGKPRDRKPRRDKPREGSGAAKTFKPASSGERKPWSGKPPRDRKPWHDKPRGKFPPRDARAREDEHPRRADESAPPPKRRETPDKPPAPEQIVIKPEPPERG
jgi:hypothetical protein